MPAKPFGLAVKALVDDGEGRCLLIRRSMGSKFFAGKWDLPGGKVDAGEDFETALRREVEEETGLNISLEGVAGVSEHEMPAVRVAVLFLEARAKSSKVQLSREHDAYEWVLRSELADRDLNEQIRAFVEKHTRSRAN